MLARGPPPETTEAPDDCVSPFMEGTNENIFAAFMELYGRATRSIQCKGMPYDGSYNLKPCSH